MTKEIFMHPIRDFRPIIRFSDIKTWFSTRQQNIIQGIRKIGSNQKKVINLEDSLEKTNEKYLQLQNQQIEIKHDINSLQKTLDKQNKRLEEVVWLLKTQFEYLEENTVDQLLEMKQREQVLDSDIKKRLKIMKKELSFSMLDQQTTIQKYFDRVLQVEQKIKNVEESQSLGLIKRLFNLSNQ